MKVKKSSVINNLLEFIQQVKMPTIIILINFFFQGSQLIHLQLTAPHLSNVTEESPILSFIQLEYYMGVRLVQNIHASLASISKVIRGAILLTDEIHALANSLLKHEVNAIFISKFLSKLFF